MQLKEFKVLIIPISVLFGFILCFILLGIFWNMQILIHFLVYLVIAVVIITGTTLLSFLGSTPFVYRDHDWDDQSKWIHPPIDAKKWNICLDTHSHTRYSDGQLTIEQQIKFHQAMGFNAWVITDHNTLKNVDEVKRIQAKYKDEFVLIQGLEYTTDRIHMCFLGISEWDCKSIPFRPTNDQIKQAIADVHKKGGLVVVCHYPWSTGGTKPRMLDHPTREQILEWGADFVEVANWDDEISQTDLISYQFTKDHPEIAPVVGTDMHQPEKDPICAWTVLHTDSFTPEGFLSELRAHRTVAVYLKRSIKYPIMHKQNKWYILLLPLYKIGEMFKSIYLGGSPSNLDGTAITMWIIYLMLGFGLFEALITLL